MNLLSRTMSTLLIAACLSNGVVAQQPLAEPFLISGKLADGRSALQKHLDKNPTDDQARFGLGVLEFMQAIEHLGQSWYAYGINENTRRIAFVRFPVPDNPTPQIITYQDARSVLLEMIEHLKQADETLAQIKSKEVKLPLHLFQFHLDIDQDGKLTEQEDLTEVYTEYFGRQFAKGQPDMADKVVTFDYADAQWLQGYSHLLRAMCEMILAYDEEPLWDVVAYRLFKNPEFKYDFLEEEHNELLKRGVDQFSWFDRNAILDAIGGIHNLNFKLIDAERLERSHQHLKQTIVHSRNMWKSALAETDDDHEWIPNQRQTSMVSLTRISDEMVATWDDFLDEVDAILDGKKLLPFWRGTDESRGVNLQKCFLQPENLDIVLWIHGAGAAPFLEQGKVTRRETWNRFNRVFGGEFFTFAAWFN